MFDDAIDPYDVGMRELSRRLEAFADTRLDPSLSGTSRMRTNVMNAAHRRAALMAADRTFVADAAATTAVPALAGERSRFASRAWRRPMAALMAGALMLALVGTASAANAGGPLYAARIWIEMANLPAGALARADAEVTRLDARLQEAKQASGSGDGPAAEAALAAYSVILHEAVDGSAADPDATAAIETNLTRHVAALTLLGNDAPSTAQDAIRHALSSSTMVLQELDDAIVHDGGGLPGNGRSGTGPTGPKGPTGPTEGKPAPPAMDPAAAPGAAPGATGKPAKTAAPAAPDRGGQHGSGHGYGNGGTPPGHADPNRPGNRDRTPRPSDKPPAPKSGGT